MRINVNKLNFDLPEAPFGAYPNTLKRLSNKMVSIGNKAGTNSDKFKLAYKSIIETISNNRSLSDALDAPIKVRALAIALQSDYQEDIEITKATLDSINTVKPYASRLLIMNMYQYYLSLYDYIDSYSDISKWLIQSMKAKDMLGEYDSDILSGNGPKWIAEQCISNNLEFDNQIKFLKLENYSSGRFMTVAKNIYFIEQLRTIPVNKPHELLNEIQNRSVFESKYDNNFLLGHKALEILIKRAPMSGIDDSWLNVIVAIAGDPRVPDSHPKYLKWWAHIESSLREKVRGWLSRLDLRLFLEALENYSSQPGHSESKRMFPSRKNFLEGLLEKGLVIGTRLYLSYGAARYLRENYKNEHLPNFSTVTDGDRSIIHVTLDGAHLIEGSHSCYLWVYKDLDESAIVFDYNNKNVRYSSLTGDMGHSMEQKGTPPVANITHNPSNFNWQHNAIQTLNRIGIGIKAKDVLSREDYLLYKRRYGVG